MRPVAAILDRYRRGAAVPAVPAIDLAAELAPVLAALDEIEVEAEQLRQAAIARAEQRLAAAAEEAAGILADGERRAEVERSRAASARRGAEEGEMQAVVAEAESKARAIRARAATTVPDLVEVVLACVQEPPQ
jgi:vacuolar-type H+-ATPase subunit H